MAAVNASVRLLGLTACLVGSAPGAGVPELREVTARMQEFVEAREIAGAVTVVAGADGLLHLGVNGMADVDAKRPMAADAMFWIASMTKPVTATAVMMMDEAGKLAVDDPVSKHLPEFGRLKDAAGRPVTVTLRQCLTHSAGLAELTPGEAARITTLAELTALVADKPVKFAPGSRWEYCQTGINAAARVVEVVSGTLFPEFLERRLFGPLGMKDTTFYPDEARVRRLATAYQRTADGRLEATSVRGFLGKEPGDRNRYPMANGGLFSTAGDYAAFCRMILNGGEFDGRRLLGAEAVRRMTGVQSGDLQTGFTPGNAWGLGWCVVREPQGVTAALSPGSFGHGGAYGTQAWIDPPKRRVYLLMVQRANFPNSDASDVRRAFQDAAARALGDR